VFGGGASLLGVYQHVLGDRFNDLCPGLQAFLGAASPKRALGPMRVVREKGWLRNCLASFLGIPPADQYQVSLDVLPLPHGERWQRRFGGYALETRQRAWRGLLLESSGPATIGFELIVRAGALFFLPRRAWVFGMPFPLCLSPKIEAENVETSSGSWTVSVRFSIPGVGPVASYDGEIRAEA